MHKKLQQLHIRMENKLTHEMLEVLHIFSILKIVRK